MGARVKGILVYPTDGEMDHKGLPIEVSGRMMRPKPGCRLLLSFVSIGFLFLQALGERDAQGSRARGQPTWTAEPSLLDTIFGGIRRGVLQQNFDTL